MKRCLTRSQRLSGNSFSLSISCLIFLQTTMEHSNAAFINLPVEMRYNYVRYIDLRDLGALMFTCKHFSELFGTDLKLQKIIYENTEQRVLHNKLRRPIKQLFMENQSTYALKIDDVEFLKYTLPDLSAKNIMRHIQPFSTDPKIVAQTKAGKKIFTNNLLPKMFDYDAAKCFDLLLETFASDVASKANANQEISSLFILLGLACFKDLKPYQSPKILPHQKVLRVLLAHVQKRKELIFSTLVKNLSPNSSQTYTYMLLTKLFQCRKLFPEFQIDLSMPIPPNMLDRWCNRTYAFEVPTLLEYVIAFHGTSGQEEDYSRFQFLLDHGAPFDVNAPYIPLLLLSPCPRSKIFFTLEKLGASINALLKPTNETILNVLLKNPAQNARLIEYVLYKGAKLTNEEEAKWLSVVGEGSPEWKIIKCQQANYNPLNNPAEIPDVAAQQIVRFLNHRYLDLESTLELNSVHDDINHVTGTWEIKDGKLVVTATHALVHKTPFKPREEEPLDNLQIFTYSVVKTINSIGLVIDDDARSEDEKIRKMLIMEFL